MRDAPIGLIIGALIAAALVIYGIVRYNRRDSKKPEQKSPGGYDVEDDGN